LFKIFHFVLKCTRWLVAKYYMALTEILTICRFHGSLSHKGSRPLVYRILSLKRKLNWAA